MKAFKFSLFVAATLFAMATDALAQDGLNGILRSSTSAKPIFAAFDVRPASANLDAIQDAVADAFRKHYDGITVNQQMAPYPLPAHAPRMTFQQTNSAAGTISAPDCPQASALITSSDKTMAKYGEFSILQGCVFQYRDGYRVNIYALFVQKSGGPNINVLGAMLGRVVTNAIGLGDSSKFIGETIDDVEARLKAITPQVALVELQPARADRTPVPDPAPAEPRAPASAAPAARTPAVPAELAAVQARIAAALAQQRAALAGGQGMAPAEGDAGSMLQARKDLSAMGLTYYSQEQFVQAVRRGDRLACELFMRAGGVKADVADKSGTTPLQAAQEPELKAMLRTFAR